MGTQNHQNGLDPMNVQLHTSPPPPAPRKRNKITDWRSETFFFNCIDLGKSGGSIILKSGSRAKTFGNHSILGVTEVH